jgi:hypothetical protein
MSSALSLEDQVEQLKHFLATAPNNWDPSKFTKKFMLPNNEYISCAYWKGVFHVTGTDIIRALVFRFQAYGRPVKNLKKFEEGVFSDLRNLKPGVDATLENPRSEFLEMLYKHNCIRTQKKQKVFFWYSVPHDKLFMDALERDLKREALGLTPTTMVGGVSSVLGSPSATLGKSSTKKRSATQPKQILAAKLAAAQERNPRSAPADVTTFDRDLLSLSMKPASLRVNPALACEPSPVLSAASFHSDFGPLGDFGTPTYEHPSYSYASSPLQPLTLDPSLLQSLDNVSFTSLLPPSEDQMVSTPSSPHPHSHPLSHSLTDHMSSASPSNDVSFSHLLQESYYLPQEPSSPSFHDTAASNEFEHFYQFPDEASGPKRTSNSSSKFTPYQSSDARFPCTFHGCSKRFKRFDLLQKHTRVHLS